MSLACPGSVQYCCTSELVVEDTFIFGAALGQGHILPESPAPSDGDWQDAYPMPRPSCEDVRLYGLLLPFVAPVLICLLKTKALDSDGDQGYVVRIYVRGSQSICGQPFSTLPLRVGCLAVQRARCPMEHGWHRWSRALSS
jgi:hypothetical protein